MYTLQLSSNSLSNKVVPEAQFNDYLENRTASLTQFNNLFY